MKRLRSALGEVWGLFVEDWTFTVAILAALVIGAFVFPRMLPPAWRGPSLFALLALALIENSIRSARPSHPPP